MAQASQAIRDASKHKYYGTIDQMMPAPGTFGITPPVMTAEVASAPPALDVNNVSGYEGTTIGDAGKYFPPPSDLLPYQEREPMPAQTNWNIPAISEDEAKEAFIQYVASKCCYGKAPARDLYYLETFTESRSSLWKTQPYRGEPVDSAMYGGAPSPWDMRVEVPEIFKDNIVRVKVPHTSSIKYNSVLCFTLFIHLDNLNCIVLGVLFLELPPSEQSPLCSDVLREIGNPASTATYWLTWKNNVFEYVVDERTGFPTELFKAVKGKKLFVDEQYMVCPVISFPIGAINQASRNAIEQHQAQFGSTARILRQRQTIELVFLTKVEYEWHGKPYSYYVYGNEHKVYAEDYPKKCGCTIV
ncbi:hypothetical protein Chor_011333 [Crotalus horridus]